VKYFTLNSYHAWHRHLEGAPLAAAIQRYAQHLEQMQGVLPAEVLSLAKLEGVDDGLAFAARHNQKQQLLTLYLRCGDVQIGYYDLVLKYEGASISPADEWMLAKIARSAPTNENCEFELAYHEVDQCEDGRIEHRLLFHPGKWFEIRCRTLHWQQFPRPNRELPSLHERFPGGPR
jgi:hypothetical protein